MYPLARAIHCKPNVVVRWSQSFSNRKAGAKKDFRYYPLRSFARFSICHKIHYQNWIPHPLKTLTLFRNITNYGEL